MTDVLDQSEIDALLAAVATDDEGPAAGDAAGAAEDGDGSSSSGPGGPSVGTYDFKRPERVSKDHIRALAAIHDGFARNFGASLSGTLRTIVDVRVVGVEQLTYSEFVHSLPNPTCFVVLQAPPLEGKMCLEISPLIFYPIVDRLLGGQNSELFIPQRPLSSIEWRLVERIVNRALDHLSESWANLIEVKFEQVQTESNPQLVHIVAPTEVVVYITFEIKMGACAGTMSMSMPFNTIETVLSKLTTQSWFGYKPKGATEEQERRLVANLAKTSVPLTSFLGSTKISVTDLRRLAVGDIIQLDKHHERDLIVRVGGLNKFAGRLGQFRGRRAMRLTRRAAADEVL